MKIKSKKTLAILAILLLLGSLLLFFRTDKTSKTKILTTPVERRDFEINVRAIGELEAARSTSIASSIRGDLGKIIYLVADGVNINQNDVLVKMDPTPFEEKVENTILKIKEQQSFILAAEKGLDWEMSQAERDKKAAEFEIEAAELELNKILLGDGPLEISRLKSLMQKALVKYEELNNYSEDLAALELEGFLNPVEIKHASKKLEEEREAFESAKLQYESYVNHVYPMQIKKAESALKQAKIKQEDSSKIRGHAIGKAMVEIQQAKSYLEDLKKQLREAEKELKLSEIYAPNSGMVVHKEDFRNGQRRKPRVGDVIVRNQVMMDLPDLNSMTVKSRVREVDLFKVNVGKKASIEVDAYPHLLFNGTITSIGVLALADPTRQSEEKYFELRVALDESDPRVRPGMTTRMVIHVDKLENALVVPLHSLFYEQKKNYCYVQGLTGHEKREVEIGMQNEEWAEIKSGLNEGEEVCLTLPE